MSSSSSSGYTEQRKRHKRKSNRRKKHKNSRKRETKTTKTKRSKAKNRRRDKSRHHSSDDSSRSSDDHSRHHKSDTRDKRDRENNKNYKDKSNRKGRKDTKRYSRVEKYQNSDNGEESNNTNGRNDITVARSEFKVKHGARNKPKPKAVQKESKQLHQKHRNNNDEDNQSPKIQQHISSSSSDTELRRTRKILQSAVNEIQKACAESTDDSPKKIVGLGDYKIVHDLGDKPHWDSSDSSQALTEMQHWDEITAKSQATRKSKKSTTNRSVHTTYQQRQRRFVEDNVSVARSCISQWSGKRSDKSRPNKLWDNRSGITDCTHLSDFSRLTGKFMADQRKNYLKHLQIEEEKKTQIALENTLIDLDENNIRGQDMLLYRCYYQSINKYQLFRRDFNEFCPPDWADMQKYSFNFVWAACSNILYFYKQMSFTPSSTDKKMQINRDCCQMDDWSSSAFDEKTNETIITNNDGVFKNREQYLLYLANCHSWFTILEAGVVKSGNIDFVGLFNLLKQQTNYVNKYFPLLNVQLPSDWHHLCMELSYLSSLPVDMINWYCNTKKVTIASCAIITKNQDMINRYLACHFKYLQIQRVCCMHFYFGFC